MSPPLPRLTSHHQQHRSVLCRKTKEPQPSAKGEGVQGQARANGGDSGGGGAGAPQADGGDDGGGGERAPQGHRVAAGQGQACLGCRGRRRQTGGLDVIVNKDAMAAYAESAHTSPSRTCLLSCISLFFLTTIFAPIFGSILIDLMYYRLIRVIYL